MPPIKLEAIGIGPCIRIKRLWGAYRVVLGAGGSVVLDQGAGRPSRVTRQGER